MPLLSYLARKTSRFRLVLVEIVDVMRPPSRDMSSTSVRAVSPL